MQSCTECTVIKLRASHLLLQVGGRCKGMLPPRPYESKCPLIWETLIAVDVALQFALMMCNGNGGKEKKVRTHL